MTVLFGHPGGNPNSHHAALAHFQAGRLEAFCVPWLPSQAAMRLLDRVGLSRSKAQRLARRNFPPLENAPLVQGRIGEGWRLLRRISDRGDERLSYGANDWLMRTMTRECRRPGVTAVHAYEDCSLWQFEEAKRLSKACIYDMPIGYYPAWEQTQAELACRYVDWLPANGLWPSRYARPEQKRKEMELADLVIVPSSFVAETICHFHPDKKIALAPYGIDALDWRPAVERHPHDMLTFLFVGQCSLRKGIPLLLEAWRLAALNGARLQLVGSWHLADHKLKNLPLRTSWTGPVSRDQLSKHYQRANVFLLPTYFEGRALVVGEAMSSGLPVLTTTSSGAQDLMRVGCGRLVPPGDLDALVEALRWFDEHRDDIPTMGRAARAQAKCCTWDYYRCCVSEAVAPFV